MTRGSKAVFGFMVCSLAGFSAGCSKEGLTTGHTACSYAGKPHAAGESFPSTDGCNTCTCDISGSVGCTLMACLRDAGGWLPPPVGDGAAADPAPDGPLISDVGFPGEDARLGNDAVADASLAVDTAADTKPTFDAARDTEPTFDAAWDTRPDAGPTFDGASGDAAKDAPYVCLWQGASLPVGGSVSDGCNTCVCMNSGIMACTERACPILDAGKDPCLLPTALVFGCSGGLVAYQDQYTLSPSTGLTITRNYPRGLGDGATVRTCAPGLPVCGTPSVVSVSTVVADLAAADVQDAFALTTTPIFGVDQRQVDGAIWSITRASGGSVLVGAPCPSPVMNSCRPIPTGVQKLADDLKSLAAAAAAQSACSAL
jgi:hypothetical protein